jgi:hypothetical protein
MSVEEDSMHVCFLFHPTSVEKLAVVSITLVLLLNKFPQSSTLSLLLLYQPLSHILHPSPWLLISTSFIIAPT